MVFGVEMYEDIVVKILEAAKRPLSISEVREALAKQLGGRVAYETAKKDLLTLSAKGLIHSKSIGRGKRVTWVFWAAGGDKTKAQTPAEKFDPFDVSIEERDSMSPEEVTILYDNLVERYGDLIKDYMGKGSRYIVLCNGKIVLTSSREPSDEEVRDLEKKLGKVCYILTKDPIEESSWSPIGNGDYYPTIEAFVGNAEWEEETVFARRLQITSDFDTEASACFRCNK